MLYLKTGLDQQSIFTHVTSRHIGLPKQRANFAYNRVQLPEERFGTPMAVIVWTDKSSDDLVI